MFRILSQAEVYRTDRIKTTLTLCINGEDFDAVDRKGMAHVEENDDGLMIFVPRLKELRDICSYTELPRRLVSYWSIDQEAAKKVIGDVLVAPIGVLKGILDRHGIVELPDEGIPDSVSPQGQEDRRHRPERVANLSDSNTGGSIPFRSRSLQRSQRREDHESDLSRVDVDDTIIWIEQDTLDYKALLYHVASAASDAYSKDALLPLPKNLDEEDDDSPIKISNMSFMIDRASKIGAAGELYVRFPVFS